MPILHAGTRAADELATADWRVVLAGLVLAFLAVLAIWLGEDAWRLLRRCRVRPLPVGCVMVLALIVAPNTLPYDHLWLAHTEDSHEAERVHASHCHESPHACSDMPLPSGPGQFLYSDALLPEPVFTERAVVRVANGAQGGRTLPPDTPPPKL
jgi:hypothetical protein